MYILLILDHSKNENFINSLCCCYTEANILTNEENNQNFKFALQFARMI